ncbi:hypothetical protein [Mucilaginibacter sp. CSA2-8R]|uniref:hypothetical protein n=1 Tax=Mucilaginibacter sp. CSA2-8R TaxID=3141542 RepID=UPI00315DEB08
MKITIVLLSAALILAGCFADPYVRDISTERPEPKNILGTYKFKEQSITTEANALPAKEPKASSITLFADGH